MSTLKKIYNLLERIDTQYHDYTLLTESQESKSISAAKKMVMQKFGWDEQRADKFIREELRGDLPVLRTRNGGKFILGVTRMFCEGQLNDGRTILRLNGTLELVASDAHINEYDRNLNGMSAQELIDRFASAMKEIGDKDSEEVGALELQENNDYDIVRIDSFEQASQYGKYTSWCVTHDENMFNHYTSNGIGQFYFCLKNGFENVPQERGEGCPLDEYGLSMVAVSVDEDGRLNTCTCRWNHDNGGNDNIMDTKQISQLIGRNFYDVFKPNNKWKEAVEKIRINLANGKINGFDDIRDFKDGEYAAVALLDKWNILSYRDKELISDTWFSYILNKNGIYDFYDGFTVVIKDFRCNYIDKNGNILSPKWFENAEQFSNGFGSIYIDPDGHNYIDAKGNILSDEFFEQSWDFDENGLAIVRHYYQGDSNSEGIINTQGKEITKERFNTIFSFHKGFARVKKYMGLTNFGDAKYGFNFINTNGDLLSDVWFKNCFNFEDDGLAPVSYYGDNFLDTKGNLILPQYCYFESGFKEGGYVIISQYTEDQSRFFNIFCRPTRKIVSPHKNFEYIYCTWDRIFYEDGFARVKYKGQNLLLDENGDLYMVTVEGVVRYHG